MAGLLITNNFISSLIRINKVKFYKSSGVSTIEDAAGGIFCLVHQNAYVVIFAIIENNIKYIYKETDSAPALSVDESGTLYLDPAAAKGTFYEISRIF